MYLYLGEFTLSYILHTRAFGTYLLGGGDYLPCRKDYKVIIFLHVNMFHYFKIPYFTCTIFTKISQVNPPKVLGSY